MKTSRSIAILVATSVALTQVAIAQPVQKPVVYPAKGQSSAQISKDDGECYGWAKQNTGIDPAAVAAAPTQPPPQPGGQRVRGAARGAAAGAVVGEIANGDAGQGAAAGAAAGVIVGGSQKRQQRRAGAQQAQQAEAQKHDAMGAYYNAYSACMQGRGYTLK